MPWDAPSPAQRAPIYALLAANTLAYIAEAIAIVAIPWFVYELTGSYAKVGLIGFFTILPRVIAVFLGGQLVDRIGFRTSSVASDLLSGISVCGIPLLYGTGNLTFTWLIVLVIIGAMFDGPGATAKEAMVPELTASAAMHLDRVNAFFQGSRRLSLLIGPVLAGFLVLWVGASNVFWINAIVFGLSALITAALVTDVAVPRDDNEPVASFWSNTMFGFRFIRQHRLLVWLAGMICLMNFLDAPLATVQLPALVREHYGSAELVGILLGAIGAGAVVGTIIYSSISPRLSRRPTFIACFFVIGLVMLAISTAPPYPVAVGAMVLMGIAAGPLKPILMSIRQERVPVQYRTRVFGTTTAISFLAIPLGQIAGGYLIEWMGVQPFILMVSLIYLTAVVSFIFNPVLREMDQPAGAVSRARSASTRSSDAA
ncbi:MFS transporter [soil metagenome]